MGSLANSEDPDEMSPHIICKPERRVMENYQDSAVENYHNTY